MSRDILNAINVSLDGYSVIISLIIAISIFSIKKIDKSVKYFAFTNLAAILYGISDLVMWISEGTDAAWKLVALPVSSYVFYQSGIIIFLFYIKYIIEFYNQVERLNVWWWRFCIIIVALYSVLCTICPFAEVFYTLGDNNVYVRGRFFFMSIAMELLLYLETLMLVVKFHNKLSNRENIGFASFIFCPFIAQIIQIANYGIALNSVGLAVSFFIIYLNMNQQLKTRLKKTEGELTVLDNKKTELLNDAIINLANLVETNETGSQHAKRITLYVKELAEICRKDRFYPDIIDEDYINIIKKVSALHDIGNIVVPYNILNIPSRVTPEQHEIIKNHTTKGFEIVNDVLSVGFEHEFIKMACEICKFHHERWDGNGYPEHLKGKEIPLAARIVAIADVYDALATPRCYKNCVDPQEAFRIIDNESGKHFDPELVMEFKKIKEKIIEITNKYSDSSYED